MNDRPMYACDYCGGEYVSPLAAAMCCDPAAYGDTD